LKYGYIVHKYGEKGGNYSGFNIGDPMQTFALLYLYDIIGIPDSDRVPINLCDLNSYDGEKVVLPMLGVAIGIQFAILPLSSKIIPCFVSSTIAKNELSGVEVEYLKKYQPIGCRDEFTLNLVSKYGIKGYLTGCITAILKKEKRKTNDKVMLVDIPEELEKYIPNEIKEKAERHSHLLPISKSMNDSDAEDLIRQSKAKLCYYRDNASLVISSRLHALVPSMAMGIPVIGVFENISWRFSWLDKFIHLYSFSEFDKIDWHPKAIDYEIIKLELIDLFKNVILNTDLKFQYLSKINDFYKNRIRTNYGNYYTEKIKYLHKFKHDGFKYIIWGCGYAGDFIYDIMKKEFPASKLFLAVDSFYTKEKWHNVKVIRPKSLDDYKDIYIICATFNGKSDFMAKMIELDKKENLDFLYCATKNG